MTKKKSGSNAYQRKIFMAVTKELRKGGRKAQNVQGT